MTDSNAGDDDPEDTVDDLTDILTKVLSHNANFLRPPAA